MSADTDPWAEFGTPAATAGPNAAAPPAAADPWTTEFGAPAAAEGGLAKAGTAGLTRGTAGVAALPGTVTGLVEQGAQAASDWVGKHIGWEATPEQKAAAAANPPGFGGLTLGSTVAPAVKQASEAGAANILAGGKAASAATGGYFDPGYQPQTQPERYAAAAGEFLPNLALGGGGLVRGVVAPAVGSVAGGDVLQKMGVSEPWARFLGAVGGSGLAHTALPSVTPELAGAAETLGAQLPAAATGGPIQRAAGWLAQKVPIAGAPLTAMAQRAGRQATAGVGSALEEAGATTPDVAGQIFKDAYSDWRTGELNPATSKTWDAVSQATDQSVTSPMTKTGQLMGEILSDRNRQGLPESPAVNDLVNSVSNPAGLSFDDMKAVRTFIGNKISPKVTPVAADQADYQRLYDTLTQDMGQAALKGGGQPAYDLWQQAVNTYKTNLGRQQAIAKIIGLDGSAPPEQVISKIQSMASGGDIGSLTKARATIGNEAWQKIAGSIASDMGRDPATGDLSLAALQKNYAGLSDAGKQALFPAGTPLRQTLDAVGPVTKSLQGIGTGLGAMAHGGIGGGLAAVAMEHILEDPIRALKIGAPALPVSMLLSIPATASSFTKYLTAYRQATTAQALGKGVIETGKALEGATRNLANTANSQLGANMDPDKVNSAVRGSWQGSAGAQNTGQGAP